MKPVDKITEDIEYDLLVDTGIIYVGIEFAPIIEHDNLYSKPYLSGCKGQYFPMRYNKGKITIQGRWDSYINDSNIQGCLEDLGLDPLNFWYLLLFIYDYSEGECFQDVGSSSGAGTQIENFLQMLEDKEYGYLIDNKTLDKITFKEPVELTLKVGKKKLTITDGTTIGLMSLMISEEYEELKDHYIFWDRIDFSNPVYHSASDMAYLFCKMFIYYFDRELKDKRTSGAKISNKEKELLSYLLYFTGISKNKNLLNPLLNNYNTVKGFIKPKKEPEFKGINNNY